LGQGHGLKFEIGIVVPTLGTRPDYLRSCLESIRSAGKAHINLVAPSDFDSTSLVSERLVDQVTEDPKSGLSDAINKGVKALPARINLINWLGDDDILKPETLETLAAEFSKQYIVLVFGNCDYIDENGQKMWSSPTGQFASKILQFGPDLIPQPGALFRRDAFEAVGGLSSNFGWAFDFDLLIKLSKVGKLKFVPMTVSGFRWHSDSLTVRARWKSVGEASKVRRSHLPPVLAPISFLWEVPVKLATYLAGLRVNRLASKAKSNGKS
jgi:GT2 family glycosyltransferase